MQKPADELGLRKETVLHAFRNVRRQFAKWLHDSAHISHASEKEWYIWVVYHSRAVQEEAVGSGIDTLIEDALHTEIKKESWEFEEPTRLKEIMATNLDDINEAGGFSMFFK
jgi:hypothetical protein